MESMRRLRANCPLAQCVRVGSQEARTRSAVSPMDVFVQMGARQNAMKYFSKPDGMPRPVYIALTRRKYSAGDAKYSVTTLLKPPRVVQLERRHDSKIIIDCRRNAKALLGTFWHNGLEGVANEYPDECEIVELRMFEEIEVTVRGKTYKVKVSGAFDLHEEGETQEEGNLFALEEGVLWDYKTCSSWILRYGPKKEWIGQLNIYARWLRKRGNVVTSIRICPMFTDHKKRDGLSKYATGDPIELPMWTDEQTDQFLQERVRLHEEAELTADDQLALCTGEERWMRETYWKVRKKGTLRSKLEKFSTEQEALDRLKELGDGYEASFCGDEPRRCNDWCNCSLHCNQFKSEFPDEYGKQIAEYEERTKSKFTFEV